VSFGLGQARDARVRVTWPDGEQGSWLVVEANQGVLMERGAEAATPLAQPAAEGS
jgi:hypothetical protein